MKTFGGSKTLRRRVASALFKLVGALGRCQALVPCFACLRWKVFIHDPMTWLSSFGSVFAWFVVTLHLGGSLQSRRSVQRYLHF